MLVWLDIVRGYFMKSTLLSSVVGTICSCFSLSFLPVHAANVSNNDVFFTKVKESKANFQVAKALLPQGFSFYGLSPDDLGPIMLYGGFEYRNFRMYRGALKVSVYQARQHLAEHTFIRNHTLQGVNLRVLNRYFTGHLSMPENNGELTVAQFFLPFINECGEERDVPRRAKVAGQNYYYLSCDKFGSHFFMSRLQRGIGLSQTLNGTIDVRVTEGVDSGKQNLVVSDYVLKSDGEKLPSNPFKLIQHIPMPINTANYFLSADFDLEDEQERITNLNKWSAADFRYLGSIFEDAWITALAQYTDNTPRRNSSEEEVPHEVKVYGISRHENGSLKFLRSAKNYIGNSISYYSSLKKKQKAISTTFTPLLAGFTSLKDLGVSLAVEPNCQASKGVQSIQINDLKGLYISCKQPFSSSNLQKSFILLPIRSDASLSLDDYTQEDASQLENFELIMLLGELSNDDIKDIIVAVALGQGWHWHIELRALSELDLIHLKELGDIASWYYDYQKDPDRSAYWSVFVNKAEGLLEQNGSRDYEVVKSLLLQAQEMTKRELKEK